jgi:3-oxoacyl-(acyl-carrier-protein) synthase
MNAVITGIGRISSSNMEDSLDRLSGRITQMRLVTTLEGLAIAAVGGAFDDAGIDFPVCNSSIGFYLGIDDAVEDIKNEYFDGILKEGILGASPLLFPCTSPNILAAQVSIAFDMRGEIFTIPTKHSRADVIEFASESIDGGYITMAIAGGISLKGKNVSIREGRYLAEFFFVERLSHAMARGAKVHQSIKR